jgi:hypothetical protein
MKTDKKYCILVLFLTIQLVTHIAYSMDSPSVLQDTASEQSAGTGADSENTADADIGDSTAVPDTDTTLDIDTASGADADTAATVDTATADTTSAEPTDTATDKTGDELSEQSVVKSSTGENSGDIVLEEPPEIVFDQTGPPKDIKDRKPYGKGAMEIGAILGAGGSTDYFSLAIGANFAYFLVPRLALGIDVLYSATWGSLKYPQGLLVIPFLKFMILRSKKVSPFIISGGGREFQWGGTDNPAKGYSAVSAWIFEIGGGVVIGVGQKVGLTIQLLTRYYAFDEDVILAGEGDKPVDSKWYFPIINFGISFYI